MMRLLLSLSLALLLLSIAKDARAQGCNQVWADGLNPPLVTVGGAWAASYANNFSRCVSEGGVDFFAVNYNLTLRMPNWVAYVVDAPRAANIAARYAQFQTLLAYAGCCLPDTAVAPGNQSTHRNFSLAGMEEGHLAPFKTMSQSLVALQYANLYTNIVPQLQAFNGGAWRSLEEQIRNWGAVGPGAVKVVVGVVFNIAAGPPPPAAAANQPAALPMYLPTQYFMALYFPGQPPGSRHRFFVFPNNGAPCGGGAFVNCQVANLAAFNAALPAGYTINLNFPPP